MTNPLKSEILKYFAKRNRTVLSWQFTEFDEEYHEFCKLKDLGLIEISGNNQYSCYVDVSLTEEGKKIVDMIAL